MSSSPSLDLASLPCFLLPLASSSFSLPPTLPSSLSPPKSLPEISPRPSWLPRSYPVDSSFQPPPPLLLRCCFLVVEWCLCPSRPPLSVNPLRLSLLSNSALLPLNSTRIRTLPVEINSRRRSSIQGHGGKRERVWTTRTMRFLRRRGSCTSLPLHPSLHIKAHRNTLLSTTLPDSKTKSCLKCSGRFTKRSASSVTLSRLDRQDRAHQEDRGARR